MRCFCVDRHRLSFLLPDMLRRAATGRVFFSEGRNLLCVQWLDEPERPYAAFFNIEKSRQKGIDANVFVVSAYEKPNLPAKLPSVTFATLVREVMSGRRPRPPREKRSTKK